MDYFYSPESSICNYLRRLRSETKKDPRVVWGPTFLEGSVSGGRVVYNFKIIPNGDNDSARQKLLEIPDVAKASVKEDESGIIVEVGFSYLDTKKEIDKQLKSLPEHEIRSACDHMGLIPTNGQFFLGRLGEATAQHARRTLDAVLERLYS